MLLIVSASAFFVPLVELVVHPFNDKRAFGFHYMLRDLCFMLLRWGQHFDFKPTDPDEQ